MEIEISKEVMAYVMPSFDCLVALLFFYMAAKLTRDWGFGSRRELLLMGHRILMFATSLSFAYHAYDIFRDPIRHGLTFSNFQLHAVVTAVAVVSSIRMARAEYWVYGKKTNGDGFAGPIPH
jgi:hypothetical protein